MEKPEENKATKNTNGLLKKEIVRPQWPDNLTTIDLSNQNLAKLDDNVKLPSKLETLNLSQNKLQVVPHAVLDHPNLKHLDLSFNKIEFFDDKPECCHTIEHLNMANNNLLGPPYWVWSETPQNLTYLNLSNNICITESLKNGYFEELLMYTTLVKHVIVFNCRLGDYKEIFRTFSRANHLEIGTADFRINSANFIENVPTAGLDECCDIEILNLINSKIYTINPNIDIYKNLIELNLAVNNISSLPDEFCDLENLEICILSQNGMVYLPESIGKLRNLKHLYLDDNDLCMIPESLGSIPGLITLDLYNNYCYEIPESVWKIAEIDVAQNYFDEPSNADYLDKREKLRLNLCIDGRMSGRKPEVEVSESYSSKFTDEDEDFHSTIHSDDGEQRNKLVPSSSEEDWSSDDYWVPGGICKFSIPTQTAWTYYTKRKIKEGSFCPVDLHNASVVEKVKYEMMCNPKVTYEVEGQFDATDDDDS